MWITDVMKNLDMSALELRRKSGIPRSTLRDIMNGTSDLRGCKASTIHKLSAALNMPMADVLNLRRPENNSIPAEESVLTGYPFAHVSQHMDSFVKERDEYLRKLDLCGEMVFLREVRNQKLVEHYYYRGHFETALFLLGVIDYLCSRHNWPSVAEYDRFRKDYMVSPIFPVNALSSVSGQNDKEQLMKNAIPFLMHFGIVETPATLHWYA